MTESLIVPESLKTIQSSMAESVSMPFLWDSENPNDFNLQTENYSKDLLSRISEQGSISAEDRLGTYNRGYWFRLFTILQDEFPTVVKLINYNEFNRLAQEYLQTFPSCSQILNYLADYFPEFMNMDHRWNTPELKKAAELDYYYIKSFDAPQVEPLDPQKLTPEELNALNESVFYLQPHVFLYEENRSFVELRSRKVEDEDLPLGLPEERESKFIIFRNLVCTLECVEISKVQWDVLMAIDEGLSFSKALESVFSNLSEDEMAKYGAEVGNWFSQWVSWGIFTLEN